jgi:hypothetical protein
MNQKTTILRSLSRLSLLLLLHKETTCFSWAMLRRRASIRLTILVREGSFGRSIRSPFCFLRRSSFSAFSYQRYQDAGRRWPDARTPRLRGIRYGRDGEPETNV